MPSSPRLDLQTDTSPALRRPSIQDFASFSPFLNQKFSSFLLNYLFVSSSIRFSMNTLSLESFERFCVQNLSRPADVLHLPFRSIRPVFSMNTLSLHASQSATVIANCEL